MDPNNKDEEDIKDLEPEKQAPPLVPNAPFKPSTDTPAKPNAEGAKLGDVSSKFYKDSGPSKSESALVKSTTIGTSLATPSASDSREANTAEPVPVKTITEQARETVKNDNSDEQECCKLQWNYL